SITGYSAEELYQITYKDITPKKWHEFEDTIIREQILKRGFSDIYEKEYIRKNGDIIPVELHVFLVKDKKENNEGMWAIVRDLTEKKRIEKENKLLQEQLSHAQKLEAIGQLAGGIAHEFNNILHAIIGYASLIDMKIDEDNPAKKHIKDLIECTNRGSSITQQVLAFSRKQPLDIKPINLNEKIKEIQKLILRLITQNISIIYELSRDKVVILADHSRIDQIIMNLVINARDDMPNGGTILIKTEQVFINNQNDIETGNYALLTVQDTGEGMDEDTLNRIFEPFFTTKPIGHGTGLGLSVIYGIVKQHNGFIKVESQKGVGTSFFIYFPLIEDESLENEKKSDNYIKGGNETILIAEDDEHVRGFLEVLLKHYGYKLILAKNGEEAVERFLQGKDEIQLCVFDLKMPVMDGKDAMFEVKKIKPECEVILISGFPGEIINVPNIKHDYILQKPIEPKKLLNLIRSSLDNRNKNG
ncbi:MAG: ATP-binding protein, partial [Thermodesulfovibrionales bacterium]|nr:ATP-binding protein [Thermodesulfovibrionales bacterium]